MKYLSLTFLLPGLVQISSAQVKFPIDPATQKITYKAVINATAMSKSTLYSASLDWFAHHFDSKNAVIQINDSVRGQFISNCNFTDTFKLVEPGIYYALLSATISYKLDIEASKGKCVLTFSELRYRYYIPQASYPNRSDTGITVENTFEKQYASANTKMNDAPKRKKTWMSFFKSCDRRFRSIILSYERRVGQVVTSAVK